MADFYTPMSSISRTRNKADSRDRTRSKSRSKTDRSDRHTGPRTPKTAVDTDDSSSESEPFTTARRSVRGGTDRRSVSFSKHRRDPVRQKSARRARPPPMPVLISSSDSDDYVQSTQPRHILKPPKYDGTTPFETFWAQFKHCAEYNRWTKTEELAYLRRSLEKEAGQVLWDYGSEVTASLKKLTAILKDRFGGSHMADKYRMEARNRRQRTGESLRTLHTDLRRLTALAFPDHTSHSSVRVL